MYQKPIMLLMTLSLACSTFACQGPLLPEPNSPDVNSTNGLTRLADGQYPVGKVTYNDGPGEYSLFLMNVHPGTPSVFRTEDLQMARLSDVEVKAKQKSYLKISQGQASLHIPTNFKIAYIHAVTQTQGDKSGTITDQESSDWMPFAGALAGQVIGNQLFTPQYYVPPAYQQNTTLRGSGGYGKTFNQAVKHYQTRYQAPPAAIQNRQTFRTRGIQSPSTSPTVRSNPNASSFGSPSNTRSTGSGYGSSGLKQSGSSGFSGRSSSSFGSGSSSSGRR